MSIRAASRLADASINTVTKLLKDIGFAADFYQAQTLVNLPCKRIQCDEVWSLNYVKIIIATPEEKKNLRRGDVYSWTGICAGTKLMVSYLVGTRGVEYAHAFTSDLASRFANPVQLSTDGYRIYLDPIDQAFGGEIDYGKFYGEDVTDRSAATARANSSSVRARHQRQPGPVDDFDQLRRASEPDDAPGHAALHTSYERLQQEDREPRARRRSSCTTTSRAFTRRYQ